MQHLTKKKNQSYIFTFKQEKPTFQTLGRLHTFSPAQKNYAFCVIDHWTVQEENKGKHNYLTQIAKGLLNNLDLIFGLLFCNFFFFTFFRTYSFNSVQTKRKKREKMSIGQCNKTFVFFCISIFWVLFLMGQKLD